MKKQYEPTMAEIDVGSLITDGNTSYQEIVPVYIRKGRNPVILDIIGNVDSAPYNIITGDVIKMTSSTLNSRAIDPSKVKIETTAGFELRGEPVINGKRVEFEIYCAAVGAQTVSISYEGGTKKSKTYTVLPADPPELVNFALSTAYTRVGEIFEVTAELDKSEDFDMEQFKITYPDNTLEVVEELSIEDKVITGSYKAVRAGAVQLSARYGTGSIITKTLTIEDVPKVEELVDDGTEAKLRNTIKFSAKFDKEIDPTIADITNVSVTPDTMNTTNNDVDVTLTVQFNKIKTKDTELVIEPSTGLIEKTEFTMDENGVTGTAVFTVSQGMVGEHSIKVSANEIEMTAKFTSSVDD